MTQSRRQNWWIGTEEFLSGGVEGVRNRGSHGTCLFLKAHPFRRRLGMTLLRCITTTVAAFRYPRRAISGVRKQIPEQHSLCVSLAESRAVECSASWPLGVVCCLILFKQA